MRRTGHIRERSPGAFEIRYSAGADPATGRRKVVTTTVRGSRKDAEKRLRELLHQADRGVHTDPSRITMRAYLTGWLAEIRDEVAPLTLQRYTSVVQQHLLPGLGNHLLTKLAPIDVKAFLAGLVRRDGLSGPLGPRSRRQIHRVLAQALGRAVEQNIIARNPTDPFRRRQPRIEPNELAVLDTAQQAELLTALKGGQLYIPTLIALATGARRSEALGLRWRHVDLDAGTVRIIETLEQTRTESGSSRRRTVRGAPSRCRHLPLTNCGVIASHKPSNC
jgi:integrase